MHPFVCWPLRTKTSSIPSHHFFSACRGCSILSQPTAGKTQSLLPVLQDQNPWWWHSVKIARRKIANRPKVEPQNIENSTRTVAGDGLIPLVPPPPVQSYKDLQNLRREVADGILVSIDIGSVKHIHYPGDPTTRLSQIGIAWLDMRDLRGWKKGPEWKPEKIAPKISARQYIVEDWAHLRKGRAFSRTRFGPASSVPCKVGMAVAKERLENLALQAKGRKIHVLFWDGRRELEMFHLCQAFPRQSQLYRFWDLQLWSPIRKRYEHGNERTRNSWFIKDVGLDKVISKGDRHIAANDAWVCVMGFIRLLQMSKRHFYLWTGLSTPGQGNYADVFTIRRLKSSWINPDFLDANRKSMQCNFSRRHQSRQACELRRKSEVSMITVEEVKRVPIEKEPRSSTRLAPKVPKSLRTRADTKRMPLSAPPSRTPSRTPSQPQLTHGRQKPPVRCVLSPNAEYRQLVRRAHVALARLKAYMLEHPA